MQIPRPFPPPVISYADAPRVRSRWRAVAFVGLVSALAFALAWLVLALR